MKEEKEKQRKVGRGTGKRSTGVTGPSRIELVRNIEKASDAKRIGKIR